MLRGAMARVKLHQHLNLHKHLKPTSAPFEPYYIVQYKVNRSRGPCRLGCNKQNVAIVQLPATFRGANQIPQAQPWFLDDRRQTLP